MNKYQKNQLLTRVSLPTKFEKVNVYNEMGYRERLTSQIATAYVKRIDEIVLQSLYELYQGKANEVIVINEVEFEKFLKRYLPIYLEEKEKGFFNE